MISHVWKSNKYFIAPLLVCLPAGFPWRRETDCLLKQLPLSTQTGLLYLVFPCHFVFVLLTYVFSCYHEFVLLTHVSLSSWMCVVELCFPVIASMCCLFVFPCHREFLLLTCVSLSSWVCVASGCWRRSCTCRSGLVYMLFLSLHTHKSSSRLPYSPQEFQLNVRTHSMGQIPNVRMGSRACMPYYSYARIARTVDTLSFFFLR